MNNVLSRSTSVFVFSAILLFVSPLYCLGEPVFFFEDTPYLSSADIPPGFYHEGNPTFLEDFEDLSLDGGITASHGTFQVSPWIDSVDADDGTIDGSGSDGESWVAQNSWVEFEFSTPYPTAAGIVITDSHTSQVNFEAFDSEGSSLGNYAIDNFGDGNSYGGTEEDRFFGIQYSLGISAIKMEDLAGPNLEVDHVQYGDAYIVDVQPDGDSPQRFYLAQNYPNPFNPVTAIYYELPQAERVGLRIFDLSGRLVRILVEDQVVPPGRHAAHWHGTDNRGQEVATGIYFYCLEAGTYAETRRMCLIR
jgi:hypothetical protein